MNSSSEREPIAIVGMGCHFPGAPTLQMFWQMLCAGVDATTPFPAERFALGLEAFPAANSLKSRVKSARWTRHAEMKADSGDAFSEWGPILTLGIILERPFAGKAHKKPRQFGHRFRDCIVVVFAPGYCSLVVT